MNKLNEEEKTTPVPWHYCRTPITIVISSSEYVVTTIGNSKRDEENAALICRAVNNHAASLALQRELVEWIKNEIENCCDFKYADKNKCQTCQTRLRLIARCEETL